MFPYIKDDSSIILRNRSNPGIYRQFHICENWEVGAGLNGLGVLRGGVGAPGVGKMRWISKTFSILRISKTNEDTRKRKKKGARGDVGSA